ncbi:hypothetical protein FSP39_009616 [Pinctada imbricata]|uniref:Major facilitator superfamily associated domain-containing protein n=1 Tax=Pinctada imbricata TaxID=66713 RepID=A0AA88YIU3_PINIB|nr:hypothetical protein FSP39_009616 [Pinctada imbricata]
MAYEVASDDSDVERSPSMDRKKYRVTSQLNAGYNSKTSGRDIIDSLSSHVNKDLLVCKLFYFFFFAAFGSLFPLLAIYFKQLGMNPSQSGVLIGFRPFVEFCSAPFWGSIADRYKKGKQLLIFSLICWNVFTVAIVFVKPPAHHCVHVNSTYHIPEGYIYRGKRDLSNEMYSAYKYKDIGNFGAFSAVSKRANDTMSYGVGDIGQILGKLGLSTPHIPVEVVTLKKPNGVTEPITTAVTKPNKGHDDSKYIKPTYSAIFYEKDAVQDAFFTLLLLIVIGEFFSAPAITFVDSVTLAYLEEDMDNYGRQRMFGSLGWGLAMFIIGVVLDQSSTFPNHPCGIQHLNEKNYVVCFAVFSVLMACALITAIQLKFDHRHGGGKDFQVMELVERVRDKVMEVITGEKRPDRGRLFNDEDDDIGYLESKASESNLEKENEERNASDPNAEVTEQPNGNGKNLQISLDNKNDMVSDAVKNSSYTKIGAEDEEDEPFLGKWFSVLKLLATFRYISVLFISWFMGFGIGLIFTFLFWHLQDIGGSPTLFGIASVINHTSELLAYFFSRNIINKFGHVKILYAGLFGNVARFLYISWLKDPNWVLPFEFVQGLTHAAVWAACCSYITHAIPVGLRSSAQGILQGLHHGLGRGCGAVFGGIMVYSYGSSVTFRVYGITCLIVLILYAVLRYFLEDRGTFSHGAKDDHQMLEEESPTLHLAPHGVPSGMARDLSSNRLKDEGLL